jgi:hypothetical protein
MDTQDATIDVQDDAIDVEFNLAPWNSGLESHFPDRRSDWSEDGFGTYSSDTDTMGGLTDGEGDNAWEANVCYWYYDSS